VSTTLTQRGNLALGSFVRPLIRDIDVEKVCRSRSRSRCSEQCRKERETSPRPSCGRPSAGARRIGSNGWLITELPAAARTTAEPGNGRTRSAGGAAGTTERTGAGRLSARVAEQQKEKRNDRGRQACDISPAAGMKTLRTANAASRSIMISSPSPARPRQDHTIAGRYASSYSLGGGWPDSRAASRSHQCLPVARVGHHAVAISAAGRFGPGFRTPPLREPAGRLDEGPEASRARLPLRGTGAG
jgi:hypothetical protein